MYRGERVRQRQQFLQKVIGRIVVVLDGDEERNRNTLRYAAGLSATCRAPVLLIFPVELPLAYPIQPGGAGGIALPLPGSVWEKFEQAADETLRNGKAEIERMGVEADGKVVEVIGSSVGRAISEALGDQSDLIVLPERKAHGLGRLLQKDKTTDIIRKVNCPVMVVQGDD
jgi:nucleotide-binding universal stress UspA family protein